MTTRVVAVVGPSGAGKDTLMIRAAERRPDLQLVRRVITRPTESGGEDFDGVSSAEFELMRSEGRFALDWRAHGLSYGVPHIAEDGLWLVNLSRGVLMRAAQVFPGLSVIHVGAAPEMRAARLANRGREGIEQIRARISREAGFHPGDLPVTYIDNSGDLEDATAAFIAALDEVLIP